MFVYVEEYNELNEKDSSAADAYTNYLAGSIGIKILVNVRENLNLEGVLNRFKQLLPELADLYFP